MTARDAAFLGCRLMALFWCVSGLIRLPYAIYAMDTFRRYGGESQSFFGNLVTSGLTESIGPLIASFVLFYGAGFVSRVLVPAAEHSDSGIDAGSALRIGIILVAIWTAAQFLPELLGALAKWLLRRDAESGQVADSWPIIVSNAIGLGIVIVAIVLAARIDKAQQ